ncbi:MAG: metallophosphoesterase [Spirochaetaceae bacterium]|jgi:predicted MPP superfamily phosphohydrolase|nr:metallophosphoesterase [Spirochaetaceae bacterium]
MVKYILVAFAAASFYIANRFLYVAKINSTPKYFVYALFIGIGLLSAAAFLGRRQNNALLPFFTQLGFIIMGVWAITISFSLINEALNLIMLVFRIKNFRYYSTLICLIICAASSVWSIVNAGFILRVKEVAIKIPSLKTHALTIAAISDIHITTFTDPQEIKSLFDKVAALHADIIVIVGDLIDTDIVTDNFYKDFGFDALQAKHGVFAVSGNHDYYTGLPVFSELCRKNNITMLQNESVLIDDTITIAGINDIDWRHDEAIKSAFTSADKNLPVLFLSHRPESFDIVQSISDYHIIQLSGHTHAGQIPPIEIARRFFMKYNYGLYYAGDAALYISSGSRWWGPPMRFGNMGEIALITLEGTS